MEDFVKISKKRLRRLLRSEAVLDALECAGVDNWIGWGEHWEIFFNEDDMEKYGVEDAWECLDPYVEENLEEYEVIKNED